MNQELVDRARALAPAIKDRAKTAEENREVPRQTVKDLISSGILQTMVPKKYGGYQSDWETMVELLIELGRGDGSQAWVAAVYTVHALDVSMFTVKAQAEVWDNQESAIVVSGVAPSGKGKRVKNGAVIKGRWAFASGVRYSNWGILGVMLSDIEGENEGHHLCLVPSDQWQTDDNWKVMGLAGTGSSDIIIKEVFVPEHRIISRLEQREGSAPGTKSHDDKIFSTPYLTIGPTALAAVIVGCAVGALDEFIAYTRDREQRGVKLAEKESIQLRVAESSAEIDCACLLLRRLAKSASKNMRTYGQLSVNERAQARRDTAYACNLSKRSVERLFEVSGAHGVYLREPFQRYYRDIKSGSNHIAIGWDRCGSAYGRVALGLEPGIDEI